MRIFDSLDTVDPADFAQGSAVAIGKFDGVHLGHQALLQRVLAVSEAQDLEPVVFTFSNNPLSFLRPELCPPSIMSPAQQLEAFADAGLGSCVIVPFDEKLASVSAEDFIEQVLVGRLRVKHLCLGADFRFGRGGAGNAALLQDAGLRFGFEVEVVPNIEDPQCGRISSSRVREAIQHGDVALASRMLGRAASMRGVVVRGNARGRELGFPTANLGGETEGLRPADGVYAGWAMVRGSRFMAAISVGANVTFEPEGEPRVEAYLLDVDEDLYGKTIELHFVQRIRDMVAFSSAEALVERMREDVNEARMILR